MSKSQVRKDEPGEPDDNTQWIAIEPQRTDAPHRTSSQFSKEHDIQSANIAPLASPNPPSFDESQFDVILRRQRVRPPLGPSRKSTTIPSRFLNLSNEFEFAGWGSFINLRLEASDYEAGEARIKMNDGMKILGQFTASALAGNVSFPHTMNFFLSSICICR